MSSSLATARHLKKVELWLEVFDINFLRSCLSSLSHIPSLQELIVKCNALGVFSVCAAHACIHTRTHKHHMSEHTAPITCPQSKYVHAVLTNRHHPHMLLCSCMHAQRTHTHSHANSIFLLSSFTTIPSTYMHNCMHMDTQTQDTNAHMDTQNICTASDCLDLTVVRNIECPSST